MTDTIHYDRLAKQIVALAKAQRRYNQDENRATAEVRLGAVEDLALEVMELFGAWNDDIRDEAAE